MSHSPVFVCCFLLVMALALVLPTPGRAAEKAPKKPAIVLAAFGTTDVEALKAIQNVESRVKAAFPGYDVHLAFTSNIIRKVWHDRANDAEFKKANPGLDEFYVIQNPITTLAMIQEEGFRPILVQPLHVTNGSEFDHVKSIVTQLAGITALQEHKIPFPYLAIGDSALGKGEDANLQRAAKALEPWVNEAKADKAALVLMGHGNEHMDVKSYRDFAEAMNKMYSYPIYLGLVEGKPEFDEVMAGLKKGKEKNVLVVPFMLVAGDHAKNDMAGDEDDSWINMLKAEGYQAKAKVEGMGLNNSWADIYVERLRSLEADLKKKL